MYDTSNDVLSQDRPRMERTTPDNPCPACGRNGWCLVRPDKTACICMHDGTGATKELTFKDGNLAYLHVFGDNGVAAGYVHPSHRATPKPAKPSIDWDRRAADAFRDAFIKRSRLADRIGVSVESLIALGVGFVGAGFEGNCWTFPERDATGKTIGIMRRLVTPTSKGQSKRCARGGSRGLTFADDWHQKPGPVLLVEGGSDVAAIMTLGLCVIGRPSNTGGFPFLIELLAQHPDREIIVIGERDRKPDGHWPGRAGAISTAEKLAAGLGRPVHWALPPDGAKDSRAWLSETSGDGRRFLTSLESTTIGPPAPRQIEPYREPTGKLVELETWRRDMVKARLETIDTPGLYFDGSPTGAGKSHADREPLRQAGKSLTLLPTHENCRELVDELSADGIDAVAYPKLSEDTCQNLQEANAALAIGLSPAAAVCPGCPYRDGCQYMREKKTADQADHAIATHSRAERGFARLADGKRFVSIHENSEALLRPSAMFRLKDLGTIALVAYEAREHEREHDEPDFELITFFDAMRDAADDLVERIDNATETTDCQFAGTMEAPKRWERLLWRAFRWLIQTTDGTQTVKISPNALRAIVGIVTGEIHCLAIQVDVLRIKKERPDTFLTIKTFLAVWQTTLPNDMPVWFADATGRADLLGTLADRKVADMTPPGRLASLTRAVQLPRDITRKTSAKTVAHLLRGILATHPDAKRVGLIGHQPHIKALLVERSKGFDKTLLDDETRSRIERSAYFGQGIDRSSNGWLDCDLLIVLGTPRIGDDGIRARLIQAGKINAAAHDGDWGDRDWEGRTESGHPVAVCGRGYLDPDWSQADRDQVRSGLLQAVGRGRGCLAEGVPVVVASTENLGLPIASTVSTGAAEAAAAVAAALKGTATMRTGHPSLTLTIKPDETAEKDEHVKMGGGSAVVSVPLKRSIKGFETMRTGHPSLTLPIEPAITTTAIAGKIGKSVNYTSRLLAEAAEAGLVERLPGRKSGWSLPTEVTEPPPELPFPPGLPPTPDFDAMPTEAESAAVERTLAEVAAMPCWGDDWTTEERDIYILEREAVSGFGIPPPVTEPL